MLAVLLVGKVVSYASLADAVRGADWRWVPVCVAGEVLAYAGYILAYRDLARVDGGPTLSYRLITRVVATSFGAYVLSSVAGPAVDFWALRRAGAGRNDAVVRDPRDERAQVRRARRAPPRSPAPCSWRGTTRRSRWRSRGSSSSPSASCSRPG